MISRLTASAALFAVLATAGLGFAAEAATAARRQAKRRSPASHVFDVRLADRRRHRQARDAQLSSAGTLPAGAQRRQSVHFQRRMASGAVARPASR